jgi:hypothetical protein
VNIDSGFVPLSWAEASNLGFVVNMLGIWGFIGLMSGGICQWNRTEIMAQSGVLGVQLYRGFAYFACGSLLVDISQFLVLIELLNPESPH